MVGDRVVKRSGHRLRVAQDLKEEEGTLWLWAWPELLDWPRDVRWLFSPVVGRDKYPGDLLGIDESGCLVLVEAKRAGSASDPYEDFVGKVDQFRALSSDDIHSRWRQLLASERDFVEQRLPSIDSVSAFTETMPGVVPYSRKRFATLRWSELYRARIAPLFSSESDYHDAVGRYLDRREANGRQRISFGALFTVTLGGAPRLSAMGRQNRQRLVREVGNDRVWVRAVRADPMQDCVELVGWTPTQSEIGAIARVRRGR